MTPKTCFWSMDVPGRDPVVLLWAWWVSLALSRSLSFVSFPVRIPVQSSVLFANDTVTSLCFFTVMSGDCGDEIPSKSKPQPAGVMSYASPANLLSFRFCFVIRLQFCLLNVHSVVFRLGFREFRECSKNLSVYICFFSNSFFNFSCPNSFSMHFLSEFRDSSVNSFSFSRLHSLKVLPYLFVCNFLHHL